MSLEIRMEETPNRDIYIHATTFTELLGGSIIQSEVLDTLLDARPSATNIHKIHRRLLKEGERITDIHQFRNLMREVLAPKPKEPQYIYNEDQMKQLEGRTRASRKTCLQLLGIANGKIDMIEHAVRWLAYIEQRFPSFDGDFQTHSLRGQSIAAPDGEARERLKIVQCAKVLYRTRKAA